MDDTYKAEVGIMSKKIFCLVFVLTMLILCGCGSCEHQWSEADCLNSSNCTLCGQIQGEALGHLWTEATCENPEICARCGETQGEALGHSYGKWMLSEEDMYRFCELCESREGTELDYQQYLNQEIEGYWNLCRIYHVEDTKKYRINDLRNGIALEPDTEIFFKADGGIIKRGYEPVDSGESWSFDHGEFVVESAEYLVPDPYTGQTTSQLIEKTQHRIYINTGEGECDSYFACMDGSITYNIVENNGDIIELSKEYGEAIEAMLSGQWYTYFDNQLYSINFSEDHSFTANFDGEINGYWQVRPFGPCEDYQPGQAYEPVPVLLNYYKDGQPKTTQAMLLEYRPGKGLEQNKDLEFLVESPVLIQNTTRQMYFTYNTGELLTEAIEKADNVPLGTWTSYSYFISTPEAQEGAESTEYSVTFLEDGSFSAKLHNEIEGTWKFMELTMENSRYPVWEYELTAPGIIFPSYFEIRSIPDIGRKTLHIEENVDEGFKTLNYYFR